MFLVAVIYMSTQEVLKGKHTPNTQEVLAKKHQPSTQDVLRGKHPLPASIQEIEQAADKMVVENDYGDLGDN